MRVFLQMVIIITILGSMMLAHSEDTPIFGGGLKAQEVSEKDSTTAKQMAQNALQEHANKDNWKGQNPRLGKSMVLHNRSPLGIEYRVHCDNEENCGFIVVTVDDMDYGLGRIFVADVETKNSLDWDEYWETKHPIPPSVHLEDMMLEEGLPKGTLKSAQKAAQKWIDENTGTDFGQWNAPKLGKRTIFPKVKGNDYQIIEYRVECAEKKECGFVNVTIQKNGEVQLSSSSTSDKAPSTWLETKPEDTPTGGKSGKLPIPKKGDKNPSSIHSAPSLGPNGNTYRNDFKQEAYCKISPKTYGSKVLITTLENPKYEENYFMRNGEFIAKNCFETINTLIYLENNSNIFALKTVRSTPFPACQEERMQWIGAGGIRTFSRDFREAGNFITADIVVDKNAFILPTWNTVEYETLPQIDTSQLPECLPNIGRIQ